MLRLYSDNVALFLALTEFQKRKMCQYGIPSEKISVLPNMAMAPVDYNSAINYDGEPYVAYAGRLSREKGIEVILQAAALLPQIKFRLAGPGADSYMRQASANVEFLRHDSQRGNSFFL